LLNVASQSPATPPQIRPSCVRCDKPLSQQLSTGLNPLRHAGNPLPQGLPRATQRESCVSLSFARSYTPIVVCLCSNMFEGENDSRECCSCQCPRQRRRPGIAAVLQAFPPVIKVLASKRIVSHQAGSAYAPGPRVVRADFPFSYDVFASAAWHGSHVSKRTMMSRFAQRSFPISGHTTANSAQLLSV